MWVLLWHSDLDVNVVISIAVAIHPPNAFPLQPDHLISLATGRNLKKQLTLKQRTDNRNFLDRNCVWERLRRCYS